MTAVATTISARRFAPLVIFGAIVVALGGSLQNDPRKMPSTMIDKPVPKFSLGPVLPDKPGLKNTTLKGRITLLNIYASWCAGCRYEHPTLMKIAAEGRYPLYGINWKDKPGDGARWLIRNKDPYVASGEDASGRVGIDLGVTGVPETFVIDSEGRIRYRHTGPVTDEIWQQVFLPLLNDLEARS